MIVELLRKYQGNRSLREYAIDLGVGYSTLSMVFTGARNPGNDLREALFTRYPAAAIEYAEALIATAQRTEQDEVTA
jgi:hypothetical protein